jgi:(1->4)-alpha-D-glucan 1-alpha-D-glucosylmutase
MAAPLSTYRLQLQPAFGFDDAAAVADYLAALGVSHAYSSPYLQAAPGSTHGYDVVDHSRVNVELGGAEAHTRYCTALGRAGLGQILDIVPNHMAITGRENAWWWDVLENGPASVYASYFDVTWDAPEAKLRNTVLMPILGDHYGRVVEAGEIRLQREGGRFTLHYFDHALPVAPRSLDGFLAAAALEAESDDLAFIATAYGRLPLAALTDRWSVRERHRDKEVLRRQLGRLIEERPEVAEAIDGMLEVVNAEPDAIDALLERQNYRIAFWRTAGRELDYRRFFDINTLIGLRAEDEQVFRDTHALILGWLDRGVIDGVRVDHPDGLRDPHQYFERLAEATGGVWVVAEKILETGERLPEGWAVAGSTGYEFGARVAGLFVDRANEKPITEVYASFTGQPTEYEQVVYEKKQQVLHEVLAADVNGLTALFVDVCERNRRYRDYTRHELHEALREVIACFPVYRSYVRCDGGERVVGDDDRRVVDEAIDRAKDRRPELDPELFDFLRKLLLLEVQGEPGGAEAELVMRFQQVTGPAMAKGVEDTAFYTYNRFVALNEVGGDPGRFGVSAHDFHAANAEIHQRWPATMLTTSTHDTKRSEDVRARLALVSEIPEEWGEAVRRWSDIVDHHWPRGWPDRNAEYLFFQTLVGAWPLDRDRALAYMEKASKEAKAHTSWVDPNPEYDEALRAFVEGAMDDQRFQTDLALFASALVDPGRVTSLAQTLLKLTSPGVPDVYQGTELWDHSLVDPDNRRPVDYPLRRRLLASLDDGLEPEEILGRGEEGLPKLWVTRQALHLRGRRPELFGPAGDYEPLAARGDKAEHAVAFSRGGGAATVVPRLVLGLGGDWGDTVVELPAGLWRNVLTGEDVPGGDMPLAVLLARFPVALLERDG